MRWPSGFLSRLAAGLLCLWSLASCINPATEEGEAQDEQGAWVAETVYRGGVPLASLALGDLDPKRPGDELAVAARSGEVFMLYREGNAWHKESLARLPGEMIACAVGELDSAHPGRELVVVGAAQERSSKSSEKRGPGVAWLFKRGAKAWQQELLLESPLPLQVVCTGEFDPEQPGDEVLVGGESARVSILQRGAHGWDHVADVALPAPAAGAVAVPEGALAACLNGSLILIQKLAGKHFENRQIARFPAPILGVAHAKGRSYVWDEGGRLLLFDGRAMRAIYQAGAPLSGVLVANLEFLLAGSGPYACGQDGRVVAIPPAGKGARALVLAHDEAPLSSLAAGSIQGLGRVLVACGGGGSVLLVRQR